MESGHSRSHGPISRSTKVTASIEAKRNCGSGPVLPVWKSVVNALNDTEKNEKNGDLDIDRRAWLHMDYLRASTVEVHSLRVVKLSVVNPNFVVLVANYFEGELPI